MKAEDHYYAPDHQHLLDLGCIPSTDIETQVHEVLEDLLPYAERIARHAHVLIPGVRWDGHRQRVAYAGGEPRRTPTPVPQPSDER